MGGRRGDGRWGRREELGSRERRGVGLRGTWSVLRIEWHGPHHLVSWCRQRGPGAARESCSSFLGTYLARIGCA